MIVALEFYSYVERIFTKVFTEVRTQSHVSSHVYMLMIYARFWSFRHEVYFVSLHAVDTYGEPLVPSIMTIAGPARTVSSVTVVDEVESIK